MFEVRMLDGKIEIIKEKYLRSFINLYKNEVFSYVRI